MDEKEREELFQLERKRNGKARYCHKCQLYKPPRAHHSRAENRYIFAELVMMKKMCITYGSLLCLGEQLHWIV